MATRHTEANWASATNVAESSCPLNNAILILPRSAKSTFLYSKALTTLALSTQTLKSARVGVMLTILQSMSISTFPRILPTVTRLRCVTLAICSHSVAY